MAKYSADIEIAVRGARELAAVTSQVQALNTAIEKLNNAALKPANSTVRTSTAGIDVYVKSLRQAEQAEKQLARAIEQRQKQSRVPSPPVPGGGGRNGGGGGGGGGGSRAGGAISSALIGGGFPLLFGQGPTAAAGGALGGLAGGLLGGGFGFALSIVGTALGDAVTKAEAFNKSLSTLNAGLSATGSASLTTADDVGRLASSLSVTKDEAIELLNTFKQFRDGDTREALAALFAPVGGASTFEAIAKAGIDEKNALSAIFSLRKEIGNDAATQLALQLKSVGATATQAKLLEIILDRSIDISVAQASQVNFTDRLLSIWESIVAGVAQALSLATQFIAKMQEGTFIKLPFLDKIIAFLGGGKGRTPEEIAGQRGQKELEQLKAYRDKVRAALAVETGAGALENRLGQAYSGDNGKAAADKAARDAQRAAEEKQRLDALLKQLREEIRIRTETIGLEESLVEARADQDDKLEAQIQSSMRLLDINSKQAVVQKNFEAGKIGRAEYTLRLQLLELDRTEDQIKYEEDLNRIFKERYGITDAIARLSREARTAAFGGTGATGTFRTDLNLMPGLTDGTLGEEYSAVKLQLDELLKIENQVISAADAIGQAFGNSFKGVIDGSMSAREALAGFFSSVADSFADMAAQMISQWIKMQIIGLAQSLLPGASTIFPQGVSNFSGAFGPASSVSFNPGASFGGFMAQGGSVSGGQSYIVGERGPELFVPGRSGTIVPNDKMGGGGVNVVVNVDAKGSSVEGNEQNANQLGRVVSAAVQSELIKQQRPGGLLAR